MAIVIPSKNIYQKENPKVRDNVIERIEVNAVEVVPDNEYETPVYNNPYVENLITETIKYDDVFNTADGRETPDDASGTEYWNVRAVAGVQNSISYFIPFVEFSQLKYNKFISSLVGNIGINIEYQYKEFHTKGTYTYSTKQYTETEKILQTTKTLTGIKISDYISAVATANAGNSGHIAKAEIKPKDESVLSTSNFEKIENTYQSNKLKILCGVKKHTISGEAYTSSGYANIIETTGIYEEYTPLKLEITVYGNTIGIDLQDKTIYINGETQKKVHSFDGNELMQTTNYIKDTGENAIEKMYGDTQLAYSRGKETATIRCSISDYYEENGEKAIATDKSTGRMSFKIGDKIIPMVYTSGGVDRAMSNYQDGSPKVFEVLGVRKYYDGAVWQELSSQEVAKNEEVSLFVNVNTGELFVSYADTEETAPIEFSYDYPYLSAEIADGVSGTLKLEDGKVILEK